MLHNLPACPVDHLQQAGTVGHEAIITDSGRGVAVIISMDDYERLHEHADIVDSLRFRELRDSEDEVMSLEDVMDALGVSLMIWRLRSREGSVSS
ncbi:type II toxin-antitoxin system prevent-host-death family antitoxin [Actinopolymorpha sp. B11F2]|uniref:type II toxin-antitoxin system prevent-host-death family antitoxin n=1 Tax=Actinopolymorpha sp. B11F2 TaxID=3160862 RepID=UPI0032E3EE6A